MGNGTLGGNPLTGWDGVAQRCAFGIFSRRVMGLGEVDAGRNLRDCGTAHEDTKKGNRMRWKGRCAKKTSMVLRSSCCARKPWERTGMPGEKQMELVQCACARGKRACPCAGYRGVENEIRANKEQKTRYFMVKSGKIGVEDAKKH